MKLFDVDLFTLENQHSIDTIHVGMKAFTIYLGKNISSRSCAYNRLVND